MELLAQERGLEFASLNLPEMDRLWDDAKAAGELSNNRRSAREGDAPSESRAFSFFSNKLLLSSLHRLRLSKP